MLRSAILVCAVATAALLSGCSSEPPVEVSASDIAATAVSALEQSTGESPEMNCGTDTIQLKNNTKLDCVLTDTTLGEDFDSEVTITDVDGANYSVSVAVAEEPRE
ncbi:DUF4333 domain-containing protein [Salinibacterium sp. UTAS2018]|uniref:DUF4333 domain-containing protein n=1 Tax=Salinibacterium sp. UTAS2018 TaxID=2508880 RepID=UPI0010096C36|nr:DUF4333 domain-containing protein [Salinibacterium sp. UTAS2018]QAV69139.1 DUF4333 domain-containing protein [Salinibacterium sp. UTAS2018]